MWTELKTAIKELSLKNSNKTSFQKPVNKTCFQTS